MKEELEPMQLRGKDDVALKEVVADHNDMALSSEGRLFSQLHSWMLQIKAEERNSFLLFSFHPNCSAKWKLVHVDR